MTKTRKRQWRYYETLSGRKPAKEFIDELPLGDRAEVFAGMKEVRDEGLRAARHLVEDIYEVRVDGENRIYRVLFAAEGRYKQVLLALEAFTKKTQKTPPKTISLAKRRLSNWRGRGG